jgi:hypothetical protein
MTSERKRGANRANARRSTGPKTAKGKASAAKNALRHGLSLSVLDDPLLAAEIESLAQRIAGPGANADIIALARRIAEVQIDLKRVRSYRRRRVEQRLTDAADRKVELSIRWLDPGQGVPAWAEEISDTRPVLATILAELARELAALDRYERRALSRRKFAIRQFDQARSEHAVRLRQTA